MKMSAVNLTPNLQNQNSNGLLAYSASLQVTDRPFFYLDQAPARPCKTSCWVTATRVKDPLGQSSLVERRRREGTEGKEGDL